MSAIIHIIQTSAPTFLMKPKNTALVLIAAFGLSGLGFAADSVPAPSTASDPVPPPVKTRRAHVDVPPKLSPIANDPRFQLVMHEPTVLMSGDGRQPYLFVSSKGTLFCQAQLSLPPFETKGKQVYHARINSVLSRDGGKTWIPWTARKDHDDVFIEGGMVERSDRNHSHVRHVYHAVAGEAGPWRWRGLEVEGRSSHRGGSDRRGPEPAWAQMERIDQRFRQTVFIRAGASFGDRVAQWRPAAACLHPLPKRYRSFQLHAHDVEEPGDRRAFAGWRNDVGLSRHCGCRMPGWAQKALANRCSFGFPKGSMPDV